MDELMIRAEAEAVTPPTADARRIDVRLVRWGEVAENTDEGIREAFQRGAFAGVDPSTVTLESQRHDGALVGVAERIDERDEDAVATFRVAETPAGDELLALTRPGPNGEPAVLRSASVVFKPIRSRPQQGVVVRQSVDLRRVAIVERGAYKGAAVLAVRSEPMDTQTTPEAPAVDLSPVLSRLDAQDARLAEIATLTAVPAAADPPELFRHESLVDYADAVYRGEVGDDLIARALSADGVMRRTIADQITDNNAGVLPPSWLTDVRRIVDLGRRAISAMGGARGLPESGMKIQWPFLASSNVLIAEQATEKTEVQSARVDIDDGESAIKTYAGGSDLSYQLLQRSTPSYREAYDRIMLAEWGRITDAAFCAALEAASGTTTMVGGGMLGPALALANPSAHADDIFDTTPDHGFAAGDAVVFSALVGGDASTAALVGRVVWVIPTSLGAKTFRVSLRPGGPAFAWGTADITAGNVHKVTDSGAVFKSLLFQASVAVEDATGQPAGVALAGTDLFLALAGLSGFVPTVPQGVLVSATGIAMASSLRMETSGLEIIRTPGVSAGKLVITNREAAAWHEDGPRFVTAENPHKLGQDVAVYSFAAPAIYAPAGIVELTLI